MIKGIIKKLIIVTISSLIPLIIFELFLSIDNNRPAYERFIYKINNVNYRFNDNPLDYLNDKNKEKIIFLGDSYTEGEVCASKKKDFVNIIKTQNEINYKKSIYNFASEGRGPVDYLNIYY